MRGIKLDPRLLVAEAHVYPADPLEPFQGPLDREGSRPSGLPFDVQKDRRGRGTRRGGEHQKKRDEHPRDDCLLHFMSFIFMSSMSFWVRVAWPALSLSLDMRSDVISGNRSSTTEVATTTLATMRSASVMRLPAMRQAIASHRRRSRA